MPAVSLTGAIRGRRAARWPGPGRAEAWPLRITAWALALGAAVALALPAGAQTVTGDVVAEENRQPLQAAVVALVDSAGQRRLGVLTDSAGRFVLRAAAPGRYRLLLSHIGRKAVYSDEVTVAAGATVRVHLEAPIAPLLLKPIVVDTRSRCKLRPEAGELASDLWEEARKAMDVSTVARGAFHGLVRTYRRELEPHSLTVVRETSSQHAMWSSRAFGSATEAELDRLGYVHQDGSDWVYAGPDELVLRSEGFMDHHCLRPVKADSKHAGLVGVAFQPVRDDRPDIEGVAWLDAHTAVLRSVEFHYTSLPWSVPEETQGGQVAYGRNPSGAITVTGWSLRMPQVQVRRAFRAPGQPPSAEQLATVLRVIEAGGDVLTGEAAGAPPSR